MDFHPGKIDHPDPSDLEDQWAENRMKNVEDQMDHGTSNAREISEKEKDLAGKKAIGEKISEKTGAGMGNSKPVDLWQHWEISSSCRVLI